MVVMRVSQTLVAQPALTRHIAQRCVYCVNVACFLYPQIIHRLSVDVDYVMPSRVVFFENPAAVILAPKICDFSLSARSTFVHDVCSCPVAW